MANQRSLRLEGWAVLLSLWVTFALSTTLSSVGLRALHDDSAIQLPTNMREAVWLVLGIWVTAYVVGLLVGFLHGKMAAWRRIVGSAILGFILGLGWHLIFLGTFPNIPYDNYNFLLDLLYLRGLPTYHAFLLLTLGIGPGIVALATYTGLLLAQEARPEDLSQPEMEPRGVLVAALLPMAAIIFILGAMNLHEQETLNEIWRDTRFAGTDTSPIHFLYLNTLINPAVNMFLAALCGLLIGFTAPNASASVYSTGVGLAIHTLLVMIAKTILAPHTPAGYFTDHLGSLQAPQIGYFVTLAFGPPLIGMVSAFVAHVVRDYYHTSASSVSR